MKKAVLIHTKDSVVTVTQEVHLGDTVVFVREQKEMNVPAAENVPVFHKMAVHDIGQGGKVFKYGEEIGIATEDIPKGSHVDVHNLRSVRA